MLGGLARRGSSGIVLAELVIEIEWKGVEERVVRGGKEGGWRGGLKGGVGGWDGSEGAC
jgi:hypothetical protein